MLTELFSKINDRFTHRRQVIVEDFEMLVFRVLQSDESDIDPDEIATLLESLGRTAEDLAAAAELVVTHREYAALINEAELEVRYKLPSLGLPASDLQAETKLFRERIALLHVIREQPALGVEVNAVTAEMDEERQRFTEAQARWLDKQQALGEYAKRLERKCAAIETAVNRLHKTRRPTDRERELMEEWDAVKKYWHEQMHLWHLPPAGMHADLAPINEQLDAERASQMEAAENVVLLDKILAER